MNVEVSTRIAARTPTPMKDHASRPRDLPHRRLAPMNRPHHCRRCDGRDDRPPGALSTNVALPKCRQSVFARPSSGSSERGPELRKEFRAAAWSSPAPAAGQLPARLLRRLRRRGERRREHLEQDAPEGPEIASLVGRAPRACSRTCRPPYRGSAHPSPSTMVRGEVIVGEIEAFPDP